MQRVEQESGLIHEVRKRALNHVPLRCARLPAERVPGVGAWQFSVSGDHAFIFRLLVLVGNSLVVIGCLGLALVASGLVAADLLAVGISSGIRIVGSVAITGCLLSAIGYGYLEH